MLIADVKKLSPEDRFLYWIKERYQILQRRKGGMPKPWTDDEILGTWYFTNVRREDDKVTKWFKENIREPLRDEPDVVFATIAFRWFNLPSTGEFILRRRKPNEHSLFTQWDLDLAIETLESAKVANGKVFTGAFNISNSGSTKPKINRVCEDYIQPVWVQRWRIYEEITKGDSMFRTFGVLKSLPGLGGSGFMAAQVICDLAYTHVLENAPDWWAWCSWGPGSKRGMNRLCGKDEKFAMPRPEWDRNLERLMYKVQDRLGLRLHARDLQNCLCEFSKYERGLEGRRLKRRYKGA